MTPEHKLALLGFLFTLAALPFLIKTGRQLKTSDAVMYATLEDNEPDFNAPAVPLSPRRARWTALALAGVFLSILVSVGMTVYAATAPAPNTAGKTAAKCPF